MKPIILVSKCLGFANCRYNADIMHSRTVESLKEHAEFIPVCPEMEIGLGVPRKPIRIVSENGKKQLYQPATKINVTKEMVDFSKDFLDGLGPVDGCILKYGSPSCGLKNVRIYNGFDVDRKPFKGSGFFGGEVLQRFSDHPVEDEGRLTNFTIRENFLTALFSMARFRNVNNDAELVDFHTRHKYLFMAYSQEKVRELGRIVARRKALGKKAKNEYLRKMGSMFSRPPRFQSWINVFHHLLGGVKKKISASEKAHFLDLVEEYRDERIPLSAILRAVETWAIRFDDKYLKDQFVLRPFPTDLMEITDSGKGRKA